MGTTDTLSAPSIDINLYDPALVDDPWPTLAVIRDMGDVVWNEHGYWMTARDRICRQAFSHYTSLGHEGLVESFFGSDAFITINDRPRHNALRDVWIAAFGHNGVEKGRSSLGCSSPSWLTFAQASHPICLHRCAAHCQRTSLRT
jgi:cytochrome P450